MGKGGLKKIKAFQRNATFIAACFICCAFFFSLSSGLTHEGHTRDVEQVYLRCSQGSLEWLYPTGAIIVNLRPNMVSPAAARLSVCIKPSAESSGTNIYLDRNGKLRLLLPEQDQARGKVHCFGIQEGALFIEAVPHMDISRRITAFQYELVSDRHKAGPHLLVGKMHL